MENSISAYLETHFESSQSTTGDLRGERPAGENTSKGTYDACIFDAILAAIDENEIRERHQWTRDTYTPHLPSTDMTCSQREQKTTPSPVCVDNFSEYKRALKQTKPQIKPKNIGAMSTNGKHAAAGTGKHADLLRRDTEDCETQVLDTFLLFQEKLTPSRVRLKLRGAPTPCMSSTPKPSTPMRYAKRRRSLDERTPTGPALHQPGAGRRLRPRGRLIGDVAAVSDFDHGFDLDEINFAIGLSLSIDGTTGRCGRRDRMEALPPSCDANAWYRRLKQKLCGKDVGPNTTKSQHLPPGSHAAVVSNDKSDTDADKLDSSTTICCSICLDEISGKHDGNAVPCCGKRFHVECLRKWLILYRNGNCPNCRFTLSKTRRMFSPC